MAAKTYDILIVGAGPAGMTAAVYSARKKYKTAIVAAEVGGAAAKSWQVENYLGYQHISGTDLVERFEDHVKEFGVEILTDTAISASETQGRFVVGTGGGKTLEGRALILAMGRVAKRLQVPGEQEYLGRGVSYCAVCDGPVFQGQRVAVIGGGNAAIETAVHMTRVASHVDVITPLSWTADSAGLDNLKRRSNVDLHEGFRVTDIRGDSRVSSIVMTGKAGESRTLEVGGVFVEIGGVAKTGFVSDVVELNERAEIVVDCSGRTSRPGVFAAGDVTSDPQKQIVIAAGEGAKAALSAADYLVKHEAPHEAPRAEKREAKRKARGETRGEARGEPRRQPRKAA